MAKMQAAQEQADVGLASSLLMWCPRKRNMLTCAGHCRSRSR
jgi:hypothetical protein